MIFDCHCHIFSKNDLSQDYRTTSRLVKRLNESGLTGKRWNTENIVRFMDHILNYEAETLFLKMRQSYGEDYAAVPLMMDGTYVTHLPGEEAERVTAVSRFTEQIINPLSQTLGMKPEPQLAHGRKDLFAHNFTTQVNELKRLKKKYPRRIYPFLGIDPRRDEDDLKGKLMELIKARVGKGKTFSGIKLYTALGYSPTHPFLYDRDRGKPTLYRWCEQNRIPLTVHFSSTGFAHINDKTPVKGDVYHPPSGEIYPAQELYDKGIVTYETRFFRHSFSEMVDERQHILNHPKLWRKVLETYPKLVLNFAHMGGYTSMPFYLQGHPKGFWTKAALEFLQDYPRTRSDMSNFIFPGSRGDILEGVKSNIYDKLSRSARKRVLYGSDFYMMFLMENDLNLYYSRFNRAFGKEMDRVARENPRDFLNL